MLRSLLLLVLLELLLLLSLLLVRCKAAAEGTSLLLVLLLLRGMRGVGMAVSSLSEHNTDVLASRRPQLPSSAWHCAGMSLAAPC